MEKDTEKYTSLVVTDEKALDDIAGGVLSALSKAASYRKKVIEGKWDKILEAYNLTDVTRLETWQNTWRGARYAIALDTLSAFAWQMLLSAEDTLFEDYSAYPADRIQTALRQSLKQRIMYHLRRENFQGAKSLAMIRSFMLYGTGAIRIPYSYEPMLINMDYGKAKLEGIGRQRFELVVPALLFRDYTCAERYEITVYFISKEELEAIAERNPETFDLEAVRNASSGINETEISSALDKYTSRTKEQDYGDLVTVIEIWGGIPKGDGSICRRFSWAAMAGREFIVKPRFYASWDAKPPVVVASLNPRPHEAWPIPQLYYSYGAFDALGDIDRRLNDKVQWAGNPLIFLSRGSLSTRMTKGVFKVGPGELIFKNTPDNVLEVNEQLSGINQQMFVVRDVFVREADRSGDNDMLHGMAAPTSRTSAKEIQTRRDMAGAQVNQIITSIERFVLTPLITKIRNSILQYETADMWLDVRSVFGVDEQIDDKGMPLSPETLAERERRMKAFMDELNLNENLRYRLVNEPDVVVTGMSAGLKKANELATLKELLTLLMSQPEFDGISGTRIRDVLFELLSSLPGINANKLMTVPEEERQAIIREAVAMKAQVKEAAKMQMAQALQGAAAPQAGREGGPQPPRRTPAPQAAAGL